MWGLKRAAKGECERACDALEFTGASDGYGPEGAFAAALAELPEELRQHVRTCEACRTFAEELAEARGLLAARRNTAEPGPFFLARVMASIAAKEAQIETKAETWAAVPRLASRLAVLASLGLLIAATWVYQMPPSTVTGWSSPQWAGLTDTGTPQDDLLVSPASR